MKLEDERRDMERTRRFEPFFIWWQHPQNAVFHAVKLTFEKPDVKITRRAKFLFQKEYGEKLQG